MDDGMATLSTTTQADYVFTEAVDVSPVGVRSEPYWYVTENGVKLGRRFFTLDLAKCYARGRTGYKHKGNRF